jgi:hypothetical protein
VVAKSVNLDAAASVADRANANSVSTC